MKSDKSTLSAGVFPARTSASPAKAPGSPENEAASGSSTPELLEKWGRGGSSSKMSPPCALADLSPSCKISARSGMMRNGIVSQLPTLVPLTAGTASGLLPTARSTDGSKGSRTPEGAQRELERGKNKDLGVFVALWPTPQHHDHHKGDPKRVGRFGTKHGGRNLNDEAALWPTPASTNPKGGTHGLDGGSRARKKLRAMVGEEEQKAMSSGSLNPTWVEWLMGFSLGWTALSASETPSSRKSSKK
jgi:hypothetical protein